MTATAHMMFWILRQTGKTRPSCAPEGYEVVRTFTHRKNAEKWAALVGPRYIDPAPIIIVGAAGYDDLREKVQS